MARTAPARWRRWAAGLVLAVLALALAVLLLTFTQAGRDQLVRLLPLIRAETGLGVRIDRIEGNPWTSARVRGLALTDRQGVFLRADDVTLDWRPLKFISANRLEIRTLATPQVRVLRRPDLAPSTSDTLLPGYDISLGQVKIDALVLEAPVTGREQILKLSGDAEVQAGRLRLMLAVDTLSAGTDGREGGGDRLRLTLDAAPDQDRLELAASLDAPEGGAVLALAGLDQPLTLRLTGQGSWSNWAGRLDGTAGDDMLAALALTGRDGRFKATGQLAPALLLDGVAARALAPLLDVDGEAILADTQTSLRLGLDGPALTARLTGRLGANEAIEAGRLELTLRKPEALYAKASGEEIRLAARLAGKLGAPIIDWTLTAQRAGWGARSLENVRGAGIIRLEPRADGAVLLPLTVSVGRVTGVGDVAEPLLMAMKGEGELRLGNGRLSGRGLKISSSKARADLGFELRLADASWQADVDARVPGQALAGLGRGDLAAVVRLVSVPSGTGVAVRGRGSVQLTALDSDALRDALGGLPKLETGLNVGPDLTVRLSGLQLASPGLALAGDVALASNDALSGTVRGKARDYGPLELTLAGTGAAPRLRLAMASPGLGLGLEQLVAGIVRAGTEWQVQADAGSSLGPISVKGALLLDDGPPGPGPGLGLRLDRADVLGLTVQGQARAGAAGPFEGGFDVVGEGLQGRISLATAGKVQAINIEMSAREATLKLDTPVLLERGRLNARILLPANGADVQGQLSLTGLTRENSSIDDVSAELKLKSGRGQAKLHASGQTDVPFELDSVVGIDGDRFEVTAKGLLDRDVVQLSGPARIIHDGTDWVLEPVRIEAGSGRAELSGRYGREGRLAGRLEKLPLSLMAAIWPALDFGGAASGQLDVRLPAGETPRGSVDVTIAGLTRSGAASSSLPVNLGLRAELGIGGTVARAVITRAGKVEGRAQARIEALAGEGSFQDRLFAAAVSGEARYDGPAQAVWGLAGNDALQVQGPVLMAARLSGTVGAPLVNGRLTVRKGRVEATLLGTVIENAELDGRFAGTGLELTRFAGDAGKGGRITGSGMVSLSAERSFPMDIRLEVKNALMLNRDDFSGTGSGTMRIATDEYGGVVSGKLNVDRANFRIGRSTADVAVLNVTERNVRSLGRRRILYVPPTRWLLNVDVRGDRRMFVSGLGMESEWRADLRVRGGAYTPELFGRVELVRGDYDFAGRRFQLTKGDLRFQGGYPPDPVIDLTAESTNNGFTALLAVNGTANKPNIRFSSVPVLPEDEVLSRLLFGESVTSLSAPEAVQLAGALASLQGGGNGFNPVNMVRRGIGIDRLRILPADQLTGRGTAVAAGQYIGRDVYVELATDAQGYTATNIEVSLTRSLSILSEVATLGGIGASLRWQKDY